MSRILHKKISESEKSTSGLNAKIRIYSQAKIKAEP